MYSGPHTVSVYYLNAQKTIQTNATPVLDSFTQKAAALGVESDFKNTETDIDTDSRLVVSMACRERRLATNPPHNIPKPLKALHQVTQ